MPLSTSLAPKYLCRSRTSMARPDVCWGTVMSSPSPLLALLEEGDQARERQRDDQVQQSGLDQARGGARGRPGGRQVAGHAGELALADLDADDEEQRSVLDPQHDLGGQ